MKYLYKILITLFALFILNSPILIPNCQCQWVQVLSGMGNRIVNSMASSGNIIFAGTFAYGVYLSTNNGTNWTQTVLNDQNVLSLAVNGNNIFAGTRLNGVYLSTNYGTNWIQTTLNNQQVWSLAVNGNNVFAGTFSPDNGVYLSTNNGTNWTQTSLNNYGVFSLAISGINIFAAAYNRVYKSTNNGTNWTQLVNLTQTVEALAINGNNIFAGTAGGGVYKSTNNGTNWTQTSLDSVWVWSLAVSGNSIFAGTDYWYNFPGPSFVVSNDNGGSWVTRNEGLPGTTVYCLSILGNFIFAGTQNSVYRRQLSELVGIQPISEQVPSHYSLEQNYPNPFNPSTRINFAVPLNKGGDRGLLIRLLIYDALGREVVTLVNEQLKPGTYEVDFDGTNYPSGVYYYKLTAGDYTETKKMVLIK